MRRWRLQWRGLITVLASESPQGPTPTQGGGGGQSGVTQASLPLLTFNALPYFTLSLFFLLLCRFLISPSLPPFTLLTLPKAFLPLSASAWRDWLSGVGSFYFYFTHTVSLSLSLDSPSSLTDCPSSCPSPSPCLSLSSVSCCPPPPTSILHPPAHLFITDSCQQRHPFPLITSNKSAYR